VFYDEWTIVVFEHAGWTAPMAFMHHRGAKWTVFLLNMKSLPETGKGGPAQAKSSSTLGNKAAQTKRRKAR
jgi:hypothetical protein